MSNLLSLSWPETTQKNGVTVCVQTLCTGRRSRSTWKQVYITQQTNTTETRSELASNVKDREKKGSCKQTESGKKHPAEICFTKKVTCFGRKELLSKFLLFTTNGVTWKKSIVEHSMLSSRNYQHRPMLAGYLVGATCDRRLRRCGVDQRSKINGIMMQLTEWIASFLLQFLLSCVRPVADGKVWILFSRIEDKEWDLKVVIWSRVQKSGMQVKRRMENR